MFAPMQQPAAEGTLQVSASQLSASVLRVHYKVHNRTSKPVYLFNQYWMNIDSNKQFEVLPNMVNVQLQASRVTVGKAVVSVPDDMEVEARYTPCLSRVEPHGDYEETIEVPMPLSPFTWYRNKPMTKGPTHRPLYFELGYIVSTPQLEARIRQVDTSRGRAFYLDVHPEHQSLLSAGPLLPDVTVFSER